MSKPRHIRRYHIPEANGESIKGIKSHLAGKGEEELRQRKPNRVLHSTYLPNAVTVAETAIHAYCCVHNVGDI
jgi:hypothetical protein